MAKRGTAKPNKAQEEEVIQIQDLDNSSEEMEEVEYTQSLTVTGDPVSVRKRIESFLASHFEIIDWQGVEIILAAACSHYLPHTEMLWLRIVGASGAGKTELLRAFGSNEKECYNLMALTPASVRGGMYKAETIIDRVVGKIAITNDLAPFLTKTPDLRKEVIGLFRPVKDGFLASDFGTTEGRRQQKSRFDWLAATTPSFESQRVFEAELGERFTDLNWRTGDALKMAIQAGENDPELGQIRQQLAKLAESILESAKLLGKQRGNVPVLSMDERKLIAEWAVSVGKARSAVKFNPYTKLLEYVPMPEQGTRLSQDFVRIALGLKMLGVEDWKEHIKRLAWDSIPSIRRSILEVLKDGGEWNISDISESTSPRIPGNTVYHCLEELHILDVVDTEEPEVEAEDNPSGQGMTLRGRLKVTYTLKLALP